MITKFSIEVFRKFKIINKLYSLNGSVKLSSKNYSEEDSIHVMKIRFERNKTAPVIVMYSLYLYFLGLSLRNTSKALIIFKDDKREVMFLYGIGFRDLQIIQFTNVKEYQHL